MERFAEPARRAQRLCLAQPSFWHVKLQRRGLLLLA
jgi:hypothetical protein